MKTRTLVARLSACLVLLNFSVPGGALVAFGVPLRESAEKALKDRAKAQKDLSARRAKSASRLLTTEEEESLQGKTGENPYLAGQSKWDVVYRGINVMTGSYTANATDLSFDGGYGIPVNVTRSYNSNNGDQGPFGKGWTLSADVRSTAGGLLKSGSAPYRSVPVGFRERPLTEVDPNAVLATGASGPSAQPVEAVIATDAGGDQETVQKDVDGILTTPPYDLNVNENTQYEFVNQGGVTYQVMTHNETVTIEGTRYVYDKRGKYLDPGMKPWNDANATAQPANVLKVVSATDRQGNVTTYTYGSSQFDYQKSNGTTRENPLTQVSMPGGHIIQFAWGSSGNTTGRVTSITDSPGDPANERKVQYAYGSGGLLTGVTTPGGKTTTYGYGAPYGGGSADFLTSITDPRGLTETVLYLNGHIPVKPYNTNVPAIAAYGLLHANGTATYVGNSSFSLGAPNNLGVGYHVPPGTPMGAGWYNAQPTIVYCDAIGDTVYFQAEIRTYPVQSDGSFAVDLNDNYSNMTASTGVMTGTYNLHSRKEFHVASQNLVRETKRTKRWEVDQLPNNRALPANPWNGQQVTVTNSYNFMGLPLSSTTAETWIGVYSGGGPYPANRNTRTATVGYSYWGPEKYFQQKAVKDQAGRYAFTDYYPNTAPAGKRGQTYRVYDAKYGGIVDTADANYPVPNGTPTGDEWRYRVRVPNANAYSAQFDYDAQGRPTDVWKLQKTSPSWSYVQTRTTYGGNGYPHWGQASQVVEDFGSGRINRTTQTLGYTSWGKANHVRDAKGQEFVTNFDKDGLVNSVTRVDVSPNQPLLTYVYGSTGLLNGQPLTITDGLAGISQTIDYATGGGGIGMPSSIKETILSEGDEYIVAYAYNALGDRTITTQTDNGVVVAKWGYFDYNWVGSLSGPSRVFQTLCRLDVNGNRTPEEFHYRFDTDGRLTDATYAMTPSASSSSASGWYGSALASSRGRSYYDYDAAGRMTGVAHYWDVLGSSGYTSTLIGENTCNYEISPTGSGLNRGLKTSSYFAMQGVNPRTETYTYEAQRDFLASATYNDGNAPNGYVYSYDPAGNRNDATTDNLNRASVVSSNVAVSSDILGNQLTSQAPGGPVIADDWDCLNRLTKHYRPGVWAVDYKYRADGMRVSKFRNGYLTRFRYDGQMGIEDVENTASAPIVTRYGLGARGVDFMERTSGTTVTTGFPIYDAHGNMVATLSRNGTGGYAVNDRRIYAAWGDIRGAGQTGDPKGRYCANLGHKQDDESGMIYMRARYYAPTTGRFISEDPARSGLNWFAYCGNNPTSFVDSDGRMHHLIGAAVLGFVVGFTTVLFSNLLNGSAVKLTDCLVGGITGAITGVGLALGGAGMVGLGAGSTGVSGFLGGIGQALLAASTSVGEASFFQILVGGALAGAFTAGVAKAVSGAQGALSSVLARNLEVSLILASMEVD